MDIISEFKNALRNLGAKHPEAYQDFVKGLQPPECKRPAVVRVTGITDSPTASPGSIIPHSSTPHHRGSNSIMEDSGISEDFIISRQQGGDKMAAPGTVSAQVLPQDRLRLLADLVRTLPSNDIEPVGSPTRGQQCVNEEDLDSDSSLDDSPVAGVGTAC